MASGLLIPLADFGQKGEECNSYAVYTIALDFDKQNELEPCGAYCGSDISSIALLEARQPLRESSRSRYIQQGEMLNDKFTVIFVRVMINNCQLSIQFIKSMEIGVRPIYKCEPSKSVNPSDASQF